MNRRVDGPVTSDRPRDTFQDGPAWRPDPLLRFLLLWTSLVTIPVWLPMVRGLVEGPVYQWELVKGIGGRGTHGAYAVLPAIAALALALFHFGWHGARPPFHWLLLTFHGALAAAVVYAGVAHPEELYFEGATAGIRFSFERIGPILFVVILLAAVLWVVRDARRGRRPVATPSEWTRAKRLRFWLVVGSVPVQVVLLRARGPFGPAAFAGVGITLWQWFVITQHLLAPAFPGSSGR
jgi:hypothetical protein